jgi:hypothetical protein
MRAFVLLCALQRATSLVLEGLTCRVTLNIGREEGTWMPPEWAASGARLSLPMDVRFSDEAVDCEEQNFLERGRTARVYCEGGSFVGPQGQVFVKAEGGQWSAAPTGSCGEHAFRFFIDFPEEATRNDVSLPAGRVYFSSGAWDVSEKKEAEAEVEKLKAEIETIVKTKDAAADYEKARGEEEVGLLERANAFRKAKQRSDTAMPLVSQYKRMLSSLPDEVVTSKSGSAELLTRGGISIKRNDARNLFGALGDVFLIMGKYSLAEAA